MTEGLNDLVAISEILKERALFEHRKNLDESRRVAQEIEQIDTLRQQALKDENSLLARQTLGADALWQNWLMRRRAELLREAAIARAYEIESLRQAQTAFAKAEASKKVLEEHIQDGRKRLMRRHADQLEELGILRRAPSAD